MKNDNGILNGCRTGKFTLNGRERERVIKLPTHMDVEGLINLDHITGMRVKGIEFTVDLTDKVTLEYVPFLSYKHIPNCIMEVVPIIKYKWILTVDTLCAIELTHLQVRSLA